MRLILILAIITAALPMAAQDELDRGSVTGPKESFEAFIEAVLNDPEMTTADRTARFESHFDFDRWMEDKQKADGKEYSQEEKASLKADWHSLFFSDEFRNTYKDSEVQVVSQDDPDWENETAELLISLKDESGTEEQFKVMMTLNRQGKHWSWYSIPRVKSAVEPDEEPLDRIEQIQKLLQEIERSRESLDAKEQELKKELRTLKTARLEREADGGKYSTPAKTVAAVWQAIRLQNVQSFLRAHTTARGELVDNDKLAERLKRDSVRMRDWEILDTNIDSDDEARAIVRVKVELVIDGEDCSKTVSLSLMKVGKDWLLDEEV
ncbi:MAG: hypothetical protein ACYTDT_06200 [Planctomycetota bacterium]